MQSSNPPASAEAPVGAPLTVVSAVIGSLIYFGAIEVGLKLFLTPNNVSTFWPAAGMYLGALLLTRRSHWWGIVLLAAAVETLSDVLHQRTALISLLYRFPNAISALGAALLINRFVGRPLVLRLRSVLVASALGVGATAVGAVFGAYVYLMKDANASYSAVWQVWWLADALGVLTVTPLILAWSDALRRRSPVGPLSSPLRFFVPLVLAAVVAHAVLGPYKLGVATVVEFPYMLTLAIVVAALYMRPLQVHSLLAVVVFVAVADTAAGHGALAAQGMRSGRGVLALQVFIAVTATVTQVVTAVMYEREHGRRQKTRAEQLLGNVFQSFPSAVAVLEADGSALRIAHANSKLLEELGCEWEELEGVPVDAIPARRNTELAKALALDCVLCASEIGGLEREHELVGQDGVRHFFHQLVELREERDKLVRIVASVTDVTALKEAERRLEEAERLAKMGSVEWDLASNEVRMSTALFALGELDEASFSNTLEELLKYHHPEDMNVFIATHQRALKQGGIHELDYRVLTREGEVRYVHSVIQGRRWPDGRARGTLSVVRDITDVKLAEAQAATHRRQLVEAEKLIALGTLVAGVAHEINNPNHFIMLNLPLLREAVTDLLPLLQQAAVDDPGIRIAGMSAEVICEELPQVVEAIHGGAVRIRGIVAELRSYASDDHSQVSDVAINDVVRSALTLIASTIKKTTYRFSAEYGEDVPALQGQAPRLEQVVMNLVLNACQSLESRHDAVWVRTGFDAATDCVLLEIEDEGCGMDDDTRQRMSEPFFTTKREHGGMGFGMAVVSRIVSDHGARLDVTSTPGKGSRFVLHLPLEAAPTSNRQQ